MDIIFKNQTTEISIDDISIKVVHRTIKDNGKQDKVYQAKFHIQTLIEILVETLEKYSDNHIIYRNNGN